MQLFHQCGEDATLPRNRSQAGLAKLVRRQTEDLQIPGSSPGARSRSLVICKVVLFASRILLERRLETFLAK